MTKTNKNEYKIAHLSFCLDTDVALVILNHNDVLVSLTHDMETDAVAGLTSSDPAVVLAL